MNVAVLDDYQRVALSYPYWETLATDVSVVPFHDHVTSVAEQAERLRPFGVVVVMRERTPLPRELLERLPNLRLVVTTGMTNTAIDLDAAAELGVTVCGTAAFSMSTVELTWALILALVRRVPAADAALRAGRWQDGTAVAGDLVDATLGVVGLGRIGCRVAAVAQAFGMRVVAWSQHLTAERAEEVGVERSADLERLLRGSDVVTLHLRLSDRTRHLIGAAELAMMKPTAYLVNTARGSLVDESALIEAVAGRRIAGVGLDVYETEPLPAGHPLRDLPNSVLTPHLGYASRATFDEFYRDIVSDIAAFLAGTPVRVITS